MNKIFPQFHLSFFGSHSTLPAAVGGNFIFKSLRPELLSYISLFDAIVNLTIHMSFLR